MSRVAALIALACVGCNALFGVDDLEVDASGGTAGGGGAASNVGGGGEGALGGGGGDGGSGLVGGGGSGGDAGGGGAGGAMPNLCDEPDLIACYPFDGNADDAGPDARHLTATAVSYVPGIDGQAVNLDMSSLLSVIDSEGAFSTAAITIEAWVRLDQPVLTGRAGVADYSDHWAIFIHPDEIRSGNSAFSASYVFAPQQWTHVALTIDATASAIYVDGLAIASGRGRVLNTTPTANPIHVGSNAPPAPEADQLIGAIDSLRIFSVARTSAQICAAANCQ